MKTLAERAQEALNAIALAPHVIYDVETSGLDWKRNSVVGYVITVSPADNWYIPIRHGGGSNLADPNVGPLVKPDDKTPIHWFERELSNKIKTRPGKIIGHSLKFDVHFSANHGIQLGRNLECTQINEALLDEHTRSFSLDACAKRHGVTEKKGDELYAHLASLFNCEPVKSSMEHYWRLSGADPIGVDYALGDGISTLELWQSQRKKIEEEGLQFIHDIESRLIWATFRIERRGIRVDVARLNEVVEIVDKEYDQLIQRLPNEFNVRSGKDVKDYVEGLGKKDWPTTELGNPSFTEKWLKGFPEGLSIIKIRRLRNLKSSFIEPLLKHHLFEGRVHSSLNQMKADDYGTISGRFSSSQPNLQQVPKRDKELSKLFRSAFIPDKGMVFYEGDYSQCFAAGTKVSVPATLDNPTGLKNIEDMEVGDLVYSFDEEKGLVLRKVTWAGKTGTKPLKRVKWRSSQNRKSEVLCTSDHLFYTYEGHCKSVAELERIPSKKGAKYPYAHRMTALSRHLHQRIWVLAPSGSRKVQESRFIFNEIYGFLPEHVHHKDGNSLNNHPTNLEGLSDTEHRSVHRPNKVDPVEIVKLLKKGLFKSEVAEKLKCTTHAVEYWRRKLIPGFVIEKGAGRINRNDVRYLINKGCDYNEAARILGCTAPTIRYHVLRLRKKPRGFGRIAPNRKVDSRKLLQRLANGESISSIAKQFKCSRKLVTLIRKEANNHVIYDIKDVKGMHPVYCIAVEDTHNFYANELLNVNCEPRLFSHYANEPTLIAGYSAEPPRDMHAVVAEMFKVERDPTAKRMNMGILTGMQTKTFAEHMDWDLPHAVEMFNKWFELFPGIKEFQFKAKRRMLERGFILTILKRRCRLDHPRFAYKAVSRIIQGGNADILKYKMLLVDEMLESEGDQVQLLMTVHDSFEWQAPDDADGRAKSAQIVDMMSDVQSEPFNLKVPFKMDVGSGKNWAQATWGDK